MVMSINTNIAANAALASLRNTQDVLQQTQIRVSTGKRVTEAKIDSSSYVIAQKLNSDFAAYGALRRGIDYSMSTVGSATKAAEEVKDLLIQIREKTIDAQKTGVTDGDRQTLQDDIDNIKNTIKVLIGSASHNGTNLIDGSSRRSAFSQDGGRVKKDARLTHVTEEDQTVLEGIKKDTDALVASKAEFVALVEQRDTDIAYTVASSLAAGSAGKTDEDGTDYTATGGRNLMDVVRGVERKDVIDATNTTNNGNANNLNNVERIFGLTQTAGDVDADDTAAAGNRIKNYFELADKNITEILEKNTEIKQKLDNLKDDNNNTENLEKIRGYKSILLSDEKITQLKKLQEVLQAQLGHNGTGTSYTGSLGEDLDFDIFEDANGTLQNTSEWDQDDGKAVRGFIADVYNGVKEAYERFDTVGSLAQTVIDNTGTKRVEYTVDRDDVNRLAGIKEKYSNQEGIDANSTGFVKGAEGIETQHGQADVGVLAYKGAGAGTGAIDAAEYQETKDSLMAVREWLDEGEKSLKAAEERFEEFKQKFGPVDQGPAQYKELSKQLDSMRDEVDSLKKHIKYAQGSLGDDWDSFSPNGATFTVPGDLALALNSVTDSIKDNGGIEVKHEALYNAFGALETAMDTAVKEKGGVLKGEEFDDGQEYVGPGSKNPAATIGSLGVLANINPNKVEQVKILAFDITAESLGIEDLDVTQNADKANKSVVEAISAVTAVIASLGSSAKQLEIQSKFTQGLMDQLQKAVGAMIDTDIAVDSAKLTALQTKKQFGIKALSIANNSSRDMLALFQN